MATITLSYQYERAQVWIDPLASERQPHSYDMCTRHGERLTPPRGWHVLDRRDAEPPTLIAV